MPTVLLCHCDGTNGSTTFIDSAGFNRVLTATSATVNTTSPKFGTGSADFTAVNTARVSPGYSPDFNFGAGPFTIEAWAYFTASSSLCAVLSLWDSSSANSWWFGMNAGSLQFFYSTDGSSATSIAAGYTPTLNTWIHLAVDRDASNVCRAYANGVVIASASAAATFFASALACRIGNDSQGSRGFPGRLDDVRIIKGTAQYGGAFTPPASPFTDPGNQIGTTYTSWSPSDKTATAGLTGNNLTASLATSSQGVRAVNVQTTGRYYFEVTGVAWASAGSAVGIANASAALGSVAASSTNAALLSPSGSLFINGSGAGSLGTRANGDVIGMAVDATGGLIWFRVAPSGNWNGNATYAPGGSGGINFAGIASGGVFPFVATNASVSTFTADFGDAAFSGAVPSGYTAGWTIAAGGAVAPTAGPRQSLIM